MLVIGRSLACCNTIVLYCIKSYDGGNEERLFVSAQGALSPQGSDHTEQVDIGLR